MPRPITEPGLLPPYSEKLKGVLAFSDFASAEKTLRKLEELRRNFHSAGDKQGVDSCRVVARLGRRRAESIGRNLKVNPAKRLEKTEMATWFRIWLETPELFQDWLALRKESAEFQKLRHGGLPAQE